MSGPLSLVTILKGSLASESAVLKLSGKALKFFEGRACGARSLDSQNASCLQAVCACAVYDGEQAAFEAICAGLIPKGSVLVIRQETCLRTVACARTRTPLQQGYSVCTTHHVQRSPCAPAHAYSPTRARAHARCLYTTTHQQLNCADTRNGTNRCGGGTPKHCKESRRSACAVPAQMWPQAPPCPGATLATLCC